MTLKLKVNGMWTQFLAPMRANVDFDTHGALKGRSKAIGEGVDFGRLPVEHRDMSLYNACFVVYSYGTPVAWKTFGVWYCPDVRYSVTTSKHMSRIRPCVDTLNAERETAPAVEPAPSLEHAARCGYWVHRPCDCRTSDADAEDWTRDYTITRPSDGCYDITVTHAGRAS